MEMIKTTGFCEMTADEMQITGSGLFDFVGDIYGDWCSMWKDFGKSVYYATHSKK